ncbi:hypothetical protein LMG26411_01139 [Cupriavidus numazuensis]|uniref:Uncharacterized protein n=1 Tax=Cupriavidus numazuensis TaxID=221992 RepID=A0ABN7PVH6_9BURK|nr:hypothetical protein LMG26411_01139 [Cupriavidus numazuensis]
MKIAVVHDWLVVYGGAERVLEQILICFPQADVFSIVDYIPPDERGFLRGKTVTTSFIQKLPFSRRKYRSYLPLMPLAIEQFDLSSYDIVITSSHAVAKGVITGPDQLHISYVHSPMRYAWDLQHQYLREAGLDVGIKGWLAKYMLHRLRLWDNRTANGVDYFVANSNFIAKRIKKAYGREADVIYPPVNVESFSINEIKEEFYLVASRLVPYKRVDLVVEAFSRMPDLKLKVIGAGPDFNKIISKSSPNVEIMGYQPFSTLKAAMQSAKAFVFAAEEDFGIAPVEALASGTPVIAFGKGGVRETVSTNDHFPTGILFDSQTPEAICTAVRRFEESKSKYKSRNCRMRSELFSAEIFRSTFTDYVTACWSKFTGEDPSPQEVGHVRAAHEGSQKAATL